MGVYKELNQSVYKEDVTQVKGSFNIAKSNTDKQMVFGWASIAKNADGSIPLDWQGDILDVETIEKAAYEFCMFYRNTGEMHQGAAKGEMIESVVFTKEKMSALGIPEGVVPEGWWVGFYIPDPEVFMKIKDGTYKMFSIQGTATRTEI